MMNIIYAAILVWMAGLYAYNNLPTWFPASRRVYGKPMPMYTIDPVTGKSILDPKWIDNLRRQVADGILPPNFDVEEYALSRSAGTPDVDEVIRSLQAELFRIKYRDTLAFEPMGRPWIISGTSEMRAPKKPRHTNAPPTF